MSVESRHASGPRNAVLFGILGFYFTAHVAVRTWSSNSLQLDEAEQLLLARDLRLGYGSQPPLYTWLQHGFFRLLGPGVLALTLLKNLLLFGIYLLSFLTARRVFADPRAPGLVLAVLTLFPGLVWESQRDQTHMVLATLLGIGLFLAFLRAWQNPGLGSYLVLGLAAGLGPLAKYNHSLTLAALLLAVAAVPATRAVLADRRLLLAGAAFALVTVPHLCWALTNPAIALSQGHKFKLGAGGAAQALGLGLVELVASVVAYAAPPLLLLAAVFAPDLRPAARRSAPPAAIALVHRTLLLGLGLATAVVLAFQVTEIKARWLQPLFILLPLPLVHWMQPRLTARRVRILFGLSGAALAAVLIALHGGLLLGRPTSLNQPYAAWSADIRRAGFTNGPIVAPHLGVAGNLQHLFPQSVVLAPDLHPAPITSDLPILVAWRPAGRNAAMTNAFQNCEALTGRRPDAAMARTAEAPLVHDPRRLSQLGYAIVPPPPTR